MARLIDADALWHRTFCCEDAADVRKEIEIAPTVDAVEVVHSSWGEGRFNTKGEYEEQCLNCKMFSSACGCDYCPNCGAKMDERREEK